MALRVSMRTIAEHAGVSAMTVSLALRGSTEVSGKTRDSIQALAKKMGFRPDPALQALVHYRNAKRSPVLSNTIAFVNNTSSASSLSLSDIYRLSFGGASVRAAELGYNVEEFWMKEPGMTPARASSILKTRGVKGLIIAPQEQSHAVMKLDWASFSAVAIGHSLENPKLHVVINNMFKSMLLCMRELYKLGYRRIGLSICRDQDERVEHRYTGAYLAACHHLGTKALPIHCPVAPDKKQFINWFRKQQPDVVIGTEKLFADYLISEQLRIPQDVGFATIFSTEALKQYAHVDGRGLEIGRLAAELVSAMINRNETDIPARPQQISIEPEWVVTDSVRSPMAHADRVHYQAV